MILNYEQIKSKKLIQNFIDKNFDNASYDLRIDKIVTVSGSVKKKLNVEPNSIAVAISKETIKLPKNIIGHAFVKTRLSQNGIMANNIGVIDPGYDGPLSSVLVNFGKNAYGLNENDVFLRLTFSKFDEPNQNIDIEYGPFGKNEYEVNRRTSAIEYLGNAFIDIEDIIKNKVTSSITKMVASFGLWAVAIGLLFAGASYLINIKDDDSIKIKNLEEQIYLFNSNQNILLKNHRQYKNRIDSLNLILKELEIKKNSTQNDSDKSK